MPYKYCGVRTFGKPGFYIRKVSEIYLANCQGNYTISARESDIKATEYGKNTTLRIFIDETEKKAIAVYVLTGKDL